MPGETKTEPKTVDWKNLPVSNGKTWQDLHNEVVKLIKNHGIDEHGEDQEHFSTGNTRAMAKARELHDELRNWEKKMEKEGIINSKDRVHRHKWLGLGTRYFTVDSKDGFNENQTTTMDGKKVVVAGGKKGKTKRKKRKTKRKKKTRKHKRRRKTRKRKRRKKRKTYKR
jgi:hypothetical protein